MSIESHVTSLELSQRLTELGVKQESYFYWCLPNENSNGGLPVNYQLADKDRLEKSCFWPKEKISAFTVSEHLDALPHRITLPYGEPYNSFRLRMEKGIWIKTGNIDNFTEFYSVNYYGDTTSQEIDWLFSPLTQNQCHENPANALAMMRIYLLENKLI